MSFCGGFDPELGVIDNVESYLFGEDTGEYFKNLADLVDGCSVVGRDWQLLRGIQVRDGMENRAEQF